MKMKLFAIALASSALCACQLAPQGLERGEHTLISFDQLSAADSQCQCIGVRLGGKVIAAKALSQEQSELEVLSLLVDKYSAKPIPEAHSNGRFIVRVPHFVDPLSIKDQYITVKGKYIGEREGKIDQADYRFPVIRAERVHQWQTYVEYYNDEDPWYGVRSPFFLQGGFLELPVIKTRIALQ
ncbi:Slp family lipoprotein [Pasteurellaceae bacterium HPA106]|uniref:Slp family lipoprotein n=1 Tax=Spirabiliibacterium pneumoniae TaxID=221400 RepID=UPI001AADF069|nr:Slp family lipoprotein [Spirabiliibacterium pneumoniae]MBE2896118.1 Slp family lipoprotein [Spirabiliibacterium pneumoniae]